MPIKPSPNESQKEFIARCMRKETQTYDRAQAYAICISKWKSRNKKK